MKSFGGGNSIPPREQFELKYLDADEEQRTEVFSIVPRASGGDVAGIMKALETSPEKSVGRLITILSKVMDNKDGLVKANWKPEVLPAYVPKEGEVMHEDDPRLEPTFRGPDGDLYPASDEAKLKEWSDKSLWTSRRRWNYLLNQDDDAVVELNDLMEIGEWVISLSAARPTSPRA